VSHRQAIERNIAGYTSLANDYDAIHTEIFNEREQARLEAALADAIQAIRSGGRVALDYGCGSGNLTRFLVSAGLETLAADVTPRFLEVVSQRYSVETVHLIGGSPQVLAAESFDIIGLYSVLHHIPDYVGTMCELSTRLKVGGVLLIEHERNRNFYFPPPELIAFREANQPVATGHFWEPERKRWQFLIRAAFTPSRHVARYRRLRRIPLEGDIHVYRDDHIDWDNLIQSLVAAGMEVVDRTDYLHFEDGYNVAAWERFRLLTSDQTSLLLRRIR
jgi:SAM-dependent methyltransferase